MKKSETETRGPSPFHLVVTSSSMLPTLREDDVLECVPCRAGDLRRGDIAILRRGGELVCHRFLGRRASLLRTQGDGRWREDAQASASALAGRAVSVLRPGARGKRRLDTPAARAGGLARIALKRAKWHADRVLREITAAH